MDKDQRRKLAEVTLAIIEAGHYGTAGSIRRIQTDTDWMVNQTTYYGPGSLDRDTIIEVTDQTTLEAAHELVLIQAQEKRLDRIGVLNFASAKNPGGGFLRGTQAQEETLARSSALYASLSSETAKPYYTKHREAKDPMYSDRMIFSPKVPVFRDDAGNLLGDPYHMDVLTAAAPNMRALAEQGDVDEVAVNRMISARVRKLFRIFDVCNKRILVLGAWGCGVFGNTPNTVAAAFARHLCPHNYNGHPRGEFYGRFDRVRFAIPDKNGANHKKFRTWFDLADGKDSTIW